VIPEDRAPELWSSHTNLPDAILLLGPTGSGKSPLGEAIEGRGLWGRLCRHFDFGRRLREIVAGPDRPEGLSQADVDFLGGVLAGGRLLEDDQFPIAEKILSAFLSAGAANSLIVLNGLPRHEGQARDVDRLVRVQAVIHLSCEFEAVRERIRGNVGGDREGRCDDDESAVRRRLEVYEERIAPLDDHYRRLGVPLVTLTVGPADTPGDVWRKLNACPCPLAT